MPWFQDFKDKAEHFAEHLVTGNEHRGIIRDYPEHPAHARPQSEIDSDMRGTRGLYEQHKAGK